MISEIAVLPNLVCIQWIHYLTKEANKIGKMLIEDNEKKV